MRGKALNHAFGAASRALSGTQRMDTLEGEDQRSYWWPNTIRFP